MIRAFAFGALVAVAVGSLIPTIAAHGADAAEPAVPSAALKVPYAFAVGGHPVIDVDDDMTRAGVRAELEVVSGAYAVELRPFYEGGKNSSATAVDVGLDLGFRRYFTPFDHSWLVDAAVGYDVDIWRYQTYQLKVRRMTATVGGGYRWLWQSRWYLTLAGGGTVTLHTHEEAERRMPEIVRGPSSKVNWMSLAAVGKVFE